MFPDAYADSELLFWSSQHDSVWIRIGGTAEYFLSFAYLWLSMVSNEVHQPTQVANSLRSCAAEGNEYDDLETERILSAVSHSAVCTEEPILRPFTADLER